MKAPLRIDSHIHPFGSLVTNKSASGVLVSADDKKEDTLENTEFKETKAPSRPQRLDAKVVRFQNNKEKWIAVVGLFNGRPYEIFTGKIEDVFVLPQSVEYGWVIKKWYSTSSVYPGYENTSTNPCSEIAMQGGDSYYKRISGRRYWL